MSGSGRPKVKVCYLEGDVKRFVSGIIIAEDDHFLTLQLDHYDLRLALSSIIKIEAERPGRSEYVY